MKNTLLFVSGLLLILFSACNEDRGTLKVTYQEASAIYGDLDEVRNQSLNAEIQNINNPGKIYVADSYILIGEEEKGIHVLDNSNPSSPVTVNFINVPGNREFFVKEDVIYAESYYDMMKIDISNINNAVLLARAEFVFQDEFQDSNGQSLLGFSFTEVTKELDEDSDIYQEITNNNLVYLDFAQNIIPKSAVPASFSGNSSNTSGTVNRITHTKDHVYIIGNKNLSIINDEGGAFEQVQQEHSFFGMDMETIFPYEDKLFIGSRASMNVYSLEDVENPNEVYRFDHATSCDPVLPVDGAAYVTLRTADFSECPGNINALVVINTENLATAYEVQEIEMASPFGMTFNNDKLYVGEGENGLKIFDATDKLNPELMSWDQSIQAYDVIPHPTRSDLVLIAGPNGLDQYNIDGTLSLNLESRIAF